MALGRGHALVLLVPAAEPDLGERGLDLYEHRRVGMRGGGLSGGVRLKVSGAVDPSSATSISTMVPEGEWPRVASRRAP